MMRAVIKDCYAHLLSWLRTASPGSLLGTGVLGLALMAAGYNWLRHFGRGNQRQRGPRPAASGQRTVSGPEWQAAGGASANTGKREPQASQQAGTTPLARSVRSRLSGVRKVTISVAGVLFEEQHAHQLSVGATVLPEVVPIMLEFAQVVDCYLLAHVVDDVGQAAVTGALEASGLIGSGLGQIPAHKLLLCSTQVGKVSMVRQLEPELHIDAESSTIHELKRFMPQLVHIVCPGQTLSASGAPNVGQATGFAAWLGLAEE
eukprot:CAMPEP_0119108388 /NCGR_PEP_ID=MMETSP1180-20130426/14104_1 /TAXON_ID=3052 ORGANISM="Chlamydomonas cf sp, Strain CCMP681" /NCGR_SAMPLE_ID=MMETSP1180 /ASSEMBLY_ACC=CAM_ASM_000741 /LENGTH=260 /DNA_ID=CAMNT_0007093995 /DNA_START=8 /DNA_END=790 /DNA_ORIENTATION=+